MRSGVQVFLSGLCQSLCLLQRIKRPSLITKWGDIILSSVSGLFFRHYSLSGHFRCSSWLCPSCERGISHLDLEVSGLLPTSCFFFILIFWCWTTLPDEIKHSTTTCSRLTCNNGLVLRTDLNCDGFISLISVVVKKHRFLHLTVSGKQT